MKRVILVSLIILSFLSAVACANTSQDVALKLVEKYRLGQNLSAISYQVASQTQTYQIIVNELGQQKGRSTVEAEIDKLIPSYKNQWNKNLASSYVEIISVEKLQSLVDEGRSSQYSNELKLKQNQIGPLMQSRSQTLINELVTKALNAAFNHAMSK